MSVYSSRGREGKDKRVTASLCCYQRKQTQMNATLLVLFPFSAYITFIAITTFVTWWDTFLTVPYCPLPSSSCSNKSSILMLKLLPLLKFTPSAWIIAFPAKLSLPEGSLGEEVGQFGILSKRTSQQTHTYTYFEKLEKGVSSFKPSFKPGPFFIIGPRWGRGSWPGALGRRLGGMPLVAGPPMGALKGLLMGGKTDLFISGGTGKPVGEVWPVGVGVSVLDDIGCCYGYKCKRSRITKVV